MGIERVSNAASYTTGNAASSVEPKTQEVAESSTIENGSVQATGMENSTQVEGSTSINESQKINIEESESDSRIPKVTDTTAALKKAVEEINKNAKHSEAQFAVHEATNRIMVKIVDKDTKKVLKEFPPEETLDMIAKAWELAGLTVDEHR